MMNMMNESYDEKECTCQARFRTDDALNHHLEEYRCQERYHLTEAERCRRHRRASDDGAQNASDNVPQAVGGPNKQPRLPRVCPHPDCEKQPAFGSRQSLRRHFLVHIDGDGPEDCVACHEVFRRPSEIVRHIEQANDQLHNNLCKRKADYLRNTRTDLKARADDELDAWENSKGKGNKRPLASLGSRPARRPRPKPVSPVETTVNNFPSEHNSISGAITSMQLDASLSLIPNGPSFAEGNFDLLEGPITASDGTSIATEIDAAPILGLLSFPGWTGEG